MAGLPLYEATWEPYSHLRFCNEHLEDFIDSYDLPEHWKNMTLKRKLNDSYIPLKYVYNK